MAYNFRKADFSGIPSIWEILQEAIQRRKEDGSDQWQDGYPNPQTIENDINIGVGYVLTLDEEIVGYSAVLINDEPAYADIEGEWLTDGDFVVFHRVAISGKHIGKGLSYEMLGAIENFAKENKISSVRADTNFDNAAMLKIFDRMGYTYCGQVYFRGSARRAFEKVLDLP